MVFGIKRKNVGVIPLKNPGSPSTANISCITAGTVVGWLRREFIKIVSTTLNGVDNTAVTPPAINEAKKKAPQSSPNPKLSSSIYLAYEKCTLFRLSLK